jgi:hypothetical protein
VRGFSAGPAAEVVVRPQEVVWQPMGRPLKLADLRKFETRTEVKLLQDLIDFLLAQNGGAVDSW